MNTHQLVIRCDTANGYYKVGWASELPLGRFQHLELLSEYEILSVLDSSNPEYSKACSKVFDLNTKLVITECENNLSLGWLNVELNLNDSDNDVKPDEFGCFTSLALKTRYRLSKNCDEVWVAIKESEINHIEARYPTRKIAELKYQIWKHQKLNILKQFDGVIKQGKLVVCNSGLWFVTEKA